MIAVILIAALLQAPTSTSQPSQAPGRLRIIVTVKSTAFCTAFRKMAVPIGFIAQRDDAAFSNLASPTPTRSPVPERDWSALTEMIAERETSWQVAQNLVLADNVMNASWQKFPRGADANVDRLRQRLQNIIDLQRAINNAYLSVGFGTDNCISSAGRTCRRDAHVDVSGELRRADTLAHKNQIQTSDPEDFPEADVHTIAHFGSITEIKYQLDLQELAFQKELQAAAATCGR